MTNVIRDYVRTNWEDIRSELALHLALPERDIPYERIFDAKRLVGEGFFNKACGGLVREWLANRERTSSTSNCVWTRGHRHGYSCSTHFRRRVSRRTAPAQLKRQAEIMVVPHGLRARANKPAAPVLEQVR